MHSLLVSKIKEELDSIEDISQGLLKVCELIHELDIVVRVTSPGTS